jgi:hypothetical protein
VPLEVRIGINSGEVVVRSLETGGNMEYTPIGHTTNLASRLQTVEIAGSRRHWKICRPRQNPCSTRYGSLVLGIGPKEHPHLPNTRAVLPAAPCESATSNSF